MKNNVVRLLWVSFAILAWNCFSSNAQAQVPFNYRLEYKQMPSGATGMTLYDVGEVNGGLFAVGSYDLGGITRGFIYDQANNQFTDMHSVFGFTSSCRGISSSGIVIGNIIDAQGIRRVYWLDYFANPPTLNLLDQQFPVIGSLATQSAVDINVDGDIVVDELNNSENGIAYVANPFGSTIVEFDMLEPTAIGDTGFVVGSEGQSDGMYSVARWHPSTGKDVFSNLTMHAGMGEVNIYGEFGAVIDNGPAAAGTPCRIGNQIDWTGSTNTAYYVSAVNDSGDLTYMATVTTTTSTKPPSSTTVEKAFFYHASQNQEFRIDNLVSDSFLNANRQNETYLTNRVSSLDLPTSVITGVVQNNTTNDRRIYFLFPEPPPTVLTYTSPDTPKAIPDAGMTASSIVVQDDFSIADVNVTLNINHGRAQDLDVYLIAPGGTRVQLFTDVGGNGLNFVGTTLDDEAATAITSGTTPFTGSFRPEGNLGALDGLISTLGLWTLEVTDDKVGKTGTILNWSFSVEIE